jgi:anthranilate synthase/aminodeoxychorismate synthase-like glutamine amidotransferase
LEIGSIVMARIVIIDNYDSFTYNLVQAVAVLSGGPVIEVFRNDAITGEELEANRPTHLIFSPGPCTPNEAGNSNEIIKYWAGKVAILGVCLGHQCIAEVFGGTVGRAHRCMHGKTSLIHHDGKTIYAGIENPFSAMRYHSLIVDPAPGNGDFEVTATTEQDEIMGIRNEKLKIEGVQFHPESFGTPVGAKILENFLRL